MSGAEFGAPWGKSLQAMTIFSCAILVGVAVAGTLTAQGRTPVLVISLGVPVVILLGALPFTIRGYGLQGDRLLVRRLLWTTEVSLRGLRGAEFDPTAMSGSIRTLGNGGLFSFSGRYRNRRLGPYRALVTDPKRAVVIHTERRTIVISPDRPHEMVGLLAEIAGGRG